MLFMVTNRRVKDGKYGDEEMPNKKFVYQFAHDGGEQGSDGFEGKGKAGFETALIHELERLRDEEGVRTPKVGIYIHGYNNDYHDSIDEIYDLEKNLAEQIGYKPVIVGFSWPSSGKTPFYLMDREEVRDSVGAFTRFLLDINQFAAKNESRCFSTSYCIAHSMGNYLLRKGMEYMSDVLGNPQGRMLFNETVMIAPDLSSEDIEMNSKGRYIADFSRRVHVYYSKHDRALKASSIKRFGGNRLGRHGANDYDNLAGNVVVINAEKYANSDTTKGLQERDGGQVSVHSSHRYHPAILKDIVQVLSSVDRSLISGRAAAWSELDPDAVFKNHYELE